ncbi:hypothetical protein BDZ97DRAFT_1660883 [Flammula alnicola]|nr:hypothetical protein BDZ97DRAFT_1660883 [Flammula alnicola]
MFTKTAVAFLLPVLAAAQQYGGGPGPSTPTSTTPAAVSVPSAPADSTGQMNVDVTFNGAFVFHPANISAPVGTLVSFFFPGGSLAHSVTQSTFAAPCTYLAANSSNSSSPVGFDSGLVTASTFTINVTDTQPIWFHCKQVTHCGSGMVGSINAPTTGTNTFDAFQAAAVALGGNAPNVSRVQRLIGGVHGVATAAPSSDAGSTSSGSGSGSASDATKVVASAGVAFLSAAVAMIMFA